MADFNFTKIIPVVVVLIVALAVVAPAVSSITAKTETVTEEHVFGNNSLNSYTVAGESAEVGYLAPIWTMDQGFVTITDGVPSWVEEPDGVYFDRDGYYRVSGLIDYFGSGATSSPLVDPGSKLYILVDGVWGVATVGTLAEQPTTIMFRNAATQEPMNIYLDTLASTSTDAYTGFIKFATYFENSMGNTIDMNGNDFLYPAHYDLSAQEMKSNGSSNAEQVMFVQGERPEGVEWGEIDDRPYLKVPNKLASLGEFWSYEILKPDSSGVLTYFSGEEPPTNYVATPLTQEGFNGFAWSTTLEEGYFVIIQEYTGWIASTDTEVYHTNPTVAEQPVVYTPVRGNVANNVFTPNETGDYLRIEGVQAKHDFYNIAKGQTYGYGSGIVVWNEAPATEGIIGATFTFTEVTTDTNVYEIGASMPDSEYLFVPYEVSYETTEKVTTELIPMGGILVMAIILVSLVLTVSLLTGRRDY